MQASNAASQSLIAGPQVHPEAISNALLEPVALPDNSPVPVRAPNTQPAAVLRALAALAHLVDAPVLALVQDSALRALEALAHDRVLAALRLPARHRARSAHHRIAHDVADSSTPKPRKAQ